MKHISVKVGAWLLVFMVGSIFTSCIPARKYEELQAKAKQCEDELKTYKDNAEKFETELKELKSEHESMETNYKRLQTDHELMQNSYETLKSQYDHMERLNKEIQEKLKFLQDEAERESSSLSLELQRKEIELLKKEDELRKLEASLKELQANLNAQKEALDAKEKRVKELEELLAKKDAIANALREKVANALLGFKDKGLTVEERNGKVYVKMEAKLLFASGSTKVGGEGKDALIKLAKVLEDQKDMEVVVEGHTDTDKLNSASYPHNNWELSVLRSTAVVEIMLDNSSMDPKVLSASGRSEYLPVSEDKSKNRRIEVILTPNLDELYEIIGQD